LDSGVNFTTREINLMSGDCLVLFTDGITEAMNSAHELYGDARLEEAVRSARALPATDLVRHIIAAATEFAGDAPQSDDMTCLALAYKEQFSVSNNDS